MSSNDSVWNIYRSGIREERKRGPHTYRAPHVHNAPNFLARFSMQGLQCGPWKDERIVFNEILWFLLSRLKWKTIRRQNPSGLLLITSTLPTAMVVIRAQTFCDYMQLDHVRNLAILCYGRRRQQNIRKCQISYTTRALCIEQLPNGMLWKQLKAAQSW